MCSFLLGHTSDTSLMCCMYPQSCNNSCHDVQPDHDGGSLANEVAERQTPQRLMLRHRTFRWVRWMPRTPRSHADRHFPLAGIVGMCTSHSPAVRQLFAGSDVPFPGAHQALIHGTFANALMEMGLYGTKCTVTYKWGSFTCVSAWIRMCKMDYNPHARDCTDGSNMLNIWYMYGRASIV